MKSLFSLLSKRKKHSRPALTDKDVFFVFGKVIKDEFGNLGAGKFQPNYYKNGTIFVRSENSAWSGELFIQRVRIIQKINKELGERIIREIKIK